MFGKILIFGWLTVLATAYKFDNIQHKNIEFEPYEILQIDPASSAAEIKKAYHKLSLIYHPDRETGDEKKFMMIAKAYAALTDEEARRNYELYGNPDGPGAVSVGIALPSWIFEKEKSSLLLGLYALAFIVTLPVAVGIWWYRAVKFGSDQVLLITEQLYRVFIRKSPDMSLKRVIMILAASLEFEHGHNSEIIDRPSDIDEVRALFKKNENLGENNKEKPLCFWYSLKARALLHAHLQRIELPPRTLEKDKLYIVKKCPILLEKFVHVFAALSAEYLAGSSIANIPRSKMPKLQTIENAMSLGPMIVQGLWMNKSPLLQLPHITEDILQNCFSKKYYVKSLLDLATLTHNDRQTIFGKLSPKQYEDAMNALARMPILEMDVHYQVLDDNDACIITERDRVTVTVTLNRKSMATVFNPKLPLKDKELDENNNELEGNLLCQPEDQDSSVVPKLSPKWRPKDKHIKKKKQGANKQKKKGQAVSRASLKKRVNPATTEETTSETEVLSTNSSVISKKKEPVDSGYEMSECEDSDHFSDEEEEEENNDDDEEEWLKIQEQTAKKNKIQEPKDKKSHSVNSKFFPEDKQEYWWIYIVNKKSYSLVTVPFLMTNLVDKEEVDLKFTAPSKPGLHTYSVIARSDSYVDLYVVKTIKLDVKKGETDTSKSHPQWEKISDDEEEKDEEYDSDD